MAGEWDVPGDDKANYDGLSNLFHLFIKNRGPVGRSVAARHQHQSGHVTNSMRVNEGTMRAHTPPLVF